MMRDFTDIDYLRCGNPRQRTVYKLLTGHRILELLSGFEPLVVGTIPVGIDIPSSDVDIICCVGPTETARFVATLKNNFGKFPQFSIRSINYPIVAGFNLDGTEFEIYAVDTPSRRQNAYRHMQIEDYYLRLKGPEFRKEIIALKTAGMKTEPAFARLLGIEGNPYEELLRLWDRVVLSGF